MAILATDRYNYPEFIPKYFEPLLNFDNSPKLGRPGPDFPLTILDGAETTLHETCQEHELTVIEFGSFT